MAMVDDKGRIFNKINIIDLMVILFIILVIAVGAKFVLVKPEPAWITAEVMAGKQPYGVIDSIEEGSLITESSGRIIGEVLAIYISPSNAAEDTTLFLNLSIEKKNNKLYFANKELSINSKIDFNIGYANIKGANIISINKGLDKEVKNIVEVIFTNTTPWVAEKISKGDNEVNSIGRIIAKIKDTEIVPAGMIVTSDTGEVYLREHPELKDVTAAFEIIANQKGDSLFFHNSELKVGKGFSFYSEEYDISGTIINIG